jgi:hypothetical protein
MAKKLVSCKNNHMMILKFPKEKRGDEEYRQHIRRLEEAV